MSITLTYSGTTLALSDRLAWTDEFSWSPVQQAMEYSTTGVPLIDVAVKQGGRPITLEGKETATWLPRATCVALEAWAALPGAEFELVLRGVPRAVLFDQARTGFEATPLTRLLDGEESPDQIFLPTFRFIEV